MDIDEETAQEYRTQEAKDWFNRDKNFMCKGQITIRPEIRKFPNLSNYEDALIRAIDKSK